MWDAHAHVIGDPQQYPFSPARSYTPAPASLESYLAMLDKYGIDHGVLVQPSVYGFDNRCLLDALDRAGGRLYGIAVPSPEATTRDLDAMHQRGVRGVRCNLLHPGGLQPEVVIGWQPALRALGWHAELQIAIDDRSMGDNSLRDLLRRFGVPVVIDHMGRQSPGSADPRSPGLRTLIDLVRHGACFVKLSAPYRLSAEPPPWRDVSPLAQTLIEANPDGCLWGSDWPHVDTVTPVATEDVFAVLPEWCPDTATRQIVATEVARKLFKLG